MKRDESGTKQRILESACRVFAEKGYRGATVAEICDAAGTNIASVNYHFRDKERLYDAVWRHAFSVASDAFPLDLTTSEDDEPAERLRRVVRTLLYRILSKGMTGYYARLQIREMVEPTAAIERMVKEVVIPQRRILIGVVRQLLGEDAPEPAVDLCVFSLASQCLFLGVSEPVRIELAKQRAFHDPTVEVFADHITEFSLAGIRHNRRVFKGDAA